MMRSTVLLASLLLAGAEAQRPALSASPSPREAQRLAARPHLAQPKRAARGDNALVRTDDALTWSEYFRSWLAYFFRLDDAVEEAFEELGDASSRWFFGQVLDLPVGPERLRHWLLQFSRMGLGWTLILHGGRLRLPALLIEGAQLVSFSLTTLRKLASMPRVAVIWREALVMGAAATGVFALQTTQVIPALSVGLHVGKSVRGIVLATRHASEEYEGWGETIAEEVEEAVDDISDTVINVIGLEDWWDDEPTKEEAEDAWYTLVGRAVSVLAASGAITAMLRAEELPKKVSPEAFAAAVAGGFMFQRNVHLFLEENLFYFKLWVLQSLPRLLRFIFWVMKSIVWPLKGVVHRILSFVRLVERKVTGGIYWFITTLFPFLKNIDGFDPEGISAFAKALPGLGKKLTKKIYRAVVRFVWMLLPRAGRGFISELIDRSERFVAPFALAALGLAVQKGMLKLSQLPVLAFRAVINPQDLIVPGVKPVVSFAIAKFRDLLNLRGVLASMIKA